MWARHEGNTILIWTLELFGAIKKTKKNAGTCKKEDGWQQESSWLFFYKLPAACSSLQLE